MTGFNSSNIVTPDTPRECNALTMNSVTALMTPHHIVKPNTPPRAKMKTKTEHHTRAPCVARSWVARACWLVDREEHHTRSLRGPVGCFTCLYVAGIHLARSIHVCGLGGAACEAIRETACMVRGGSARGLDGPACGGALGLG
jgi:hypothetical protein